MEIHAGKIRYFLCIGLSLALNAAIAGTPSPLKDVPEQYLMEEPTLNLEYDIRAIKYDEIPASLHKAMRLSDVRWWYYGKYDDSQVSGKQYFMIAGLTPARDDSQEVMVLHAGKYENVDSIMGYADPSNKVPERVVVGLSRDAAAQLVKAFGSAEAVDRAISAQAPPDKGVMVILQKELVDALHALGVKKVCLADVAHNDYTVCAK